MRAAVTRRRLLPAAALGAALGLAVPASGYWTGRAEPTVTVRAAILGAPVATAVSDGTTITVTVGAPATGPAPTAYTVSRGPLVVCTRDTPGVCPTDPVGTAGTVVTYTVSARLGLAWVRTATLVTATAPPAPTSLTLAPSSDTGVAGDGVTRLARPSFITRVLRTPSPYTLSLVIDGSVVTRRTVSAGTGAVNLTVGLPSGVHLTDGHHQVSATTSITPAPGAGAVSGPAVPFAPVSGLTVLTPGPHVTSVSTAGWDDGLLDPGDKVTVSFDRPMDPRSICSDWGTQAGEGYASATLQVEVVDDGSTGGDRLVLSTPDDCGAGLHLGQLLPSGDWVRHGGALFVDGTVELSPDWTQVTLTLGEATVPPTPTPPAGGPGGTGAPTVTLEPVTPGPTDIAGNPLLPGTSAPPAGSANPG